MMSTKPNETAVPIDETSQIRLKFDSNGLLPCIVQDSESREILMFAFMNEEAFRLTCETGFAHYYSRSRNRLWKKGESSGHTQEIVSIRVDCDQDVVLILVKQISAACHTGYRSCFYRDLVINENAPVILRDIGGRKLFNPAEVYGGG